MAVPKLWSKSTNVSAGQSRFCSSSRVHDLAGMLEEHPKDPERLLLKFHLQAVLAQLTRAKVNLKDPEADGSTFGGEVDRFPSRTWLECSAPSGRGQAWTGLPWPATAAGGSAGLPPAVVRASCLHNAVPHLGLAPTSHLRPLRLSRCRSGRSRNSGRDARTTPCTMPPPGWDEAVVYLRSSL